MSQCYNIVNRWLHIYTVIWDEVNYQLVVTCSCDSWLNRWAAPWQYCGEREGVGTSKSLVGVKSDLQIKGNYFHMKHSRPQELWNVANISMGLLHNDCCR